MAGLSSLAPPGPGRTLAVAYAVFALAAGARSIAQIATRFAEAPLPYLLSALAACLYVLAALTVGSTDPGRIRVARIVCTIELAGVLSVGALGAIDPGALPDETVWSGFGRDYGFLPLVLPVLGLVWLARTRREI